MFVVAYITAPESEGKKIARHLVERRLAACVNIVGVESVYRWEGKVEEDKEALLIAKTKADKVQELIEEVRKIHPYKLPEIIVVPITQGLREYLAWVEQETS